MENEAFSGIADYLRERRQREGLSQSELSDALSRRDAVFDGVDALTLSRWETGKISPSIQRQIALMQFFGDRPQLLLGDPGFALKQLPSMAAFHKLMRENLVFNHVMGGHPYFDHEAQDFSKITDPDSVYPDWPLWVCNYQRNLTRGREDWSPQWLRELAAHPGSRTLLYLHHGIVGGHMVCVRLTEEARQQVLSGELDETELAAEHLVGPSDPGWLYLLSFYLGSQGICLDLVTHTILTVLEESDTRGFSLKARANFGVKVMDILTGEPVTRGPKADGNREGARYLGTYYLYLGYAFSRDDLLASPMMLNLLRGVER